jgi:agmatinase
MESPRFTGPQTFARLPHTRDLDGVDVAFVGVPFDTGVIHRVGGRFGPAAVRSASVLLRPYNANLQVHPFEVLSCVDYGDVSIVPGYITRSYDAIEAAVAPIVEAGVVPILIGGDHSCTLPHLRAMRRRGTDRRSRLRRAYRRLGFLLRRAVHARHVDAAGRRRGPR